MTFFGFEISKKGLFFNQAALNVTAHNVANADTKGYTRQRVIGSSIEPGMSSSLLADYSNRIGEGVDIQTIERIRNDFLDRQFREENSSTGEWNVKSEALSYMEDIFKEPSDTGISHALNLFFNGLEELSKNVGSKDVRTSFMQQAISLTETLNYTSNQLQKALKDQEFQLAQSVKQVNETIKNIESLNEQIARYELSGQNANDLRDKRDVFMDQLSEYVDVTFSEVLVNDRSNSAQQVLLPDPDQMPPFLSGKLKGHVDMITGATDQQKGIPYFLNLLDDFAQKLVTEFNAVHKAGWTYPNTEENIESQTGINFFDDTCTKASNIRINPLLTNVNYIAGSSGKVEAGENTGNNENILALLALRDDDTKGDFEAFLRSFASELGVETSYANNMSTNRGYLLSNIEYRRESISGVSLDEEMANMIKYEKSYQASSRMITAMDEMLDYLINKTGLVGR